MSVNDLNNFGRFGGENAKTVVPETASQQKATVDGRNETVGSNLQFLTEIVAEVTTNCWIVVVVRLH